MALSYDRKVFFDHVRRKPFGRLSQGQVNGLERLLKAWEKHYAAHPQEHLAYCLATSFWETGRKMLPVREIGKGRGRRYGRRAGPYGHVYYGRGDVQLTWHRNYKFAGQKIAVNLEKYPDQALNPPSSARVLFQGSLEGWFTTKKLSDYGTYKDMRRVINGTDRAAKIAAFAKNFEAALKASKKEITETEKVVTDMGAFIKLALKMFTGDKAQGIFSALIAAVLGTKVGGDAGGFTDIIANLKTLNWPEIIAGVWALFAGGKQVQKAVAPEPEDIFVDAGPEGEAPLKLSNEGGELAQAMDRVAKGEIDIDSPVAVAEVLSDEVRDANEIFELGLAYGAHFAKKTP